MTPLYYVTFTTATLCASFILFQGFNTTDPVNTISLLCGFLIIFSGVYLLNLSRGDPNGKQLTANGRASVSYDAAVPTDGITGLQVRRSMQLRRSDVGGTRGSIGARLLGREDEESAVGLTDLAEDSDSYSEDNDGMGRVERR